MSAFVCVQNDVLNELLKALGLEGQPTTAITLDFRVCEVATITITRHLSQEEAEKLVEVVKKYELHVGNEMVRPPLKFSDHTERVAEAMENAPQCLKDDDCLDHAAVHRQLMGEPND